MFTRTIKKAWYLVPRIELIDNRAEIAYDEVEAWFPERWEKKKRKGQFHQEKRSSL